MVLVIIKIILDIIRVAVWWGGRLRFKNNCFFSFWNAVLTLLNEKTFVWRQDKALIDIFWLVYFKVQSKLGLRNKWLKKDKMSQRGQGGWKRQKNCHLLFEWPLISEKVRNQIFGREMIIFQSFLRTSFLLEAVGIVAKISLRMNHQRQI